MRRTLSIVGILALLCLPGTAARAQSERIRDFHSDIRLLDDGTLLVKETITVFSMGNQIRHGIYREFPTRYKDRLGNKYVVGFCWNGALRDGHRRSIPVRTGPASAAPHSPAASQTVSPAPSLPPLPLQARAAEIQAETPVVVAEAEVGERNYYETMSK